MNCNANNPCMGIYGKCLDIKITNACNGHCKFCIEKNGYSAKEEPVEKMIESTNNLKKYKKVLILGGEPFLYPYLKEFVYGIRNKEEIYITTNGSAFNDEELPEIAKYLTAINISIHHYEEDINSTIFGTKISFEKIKKSIEILKTSGVKVRINTNLMKGGIDTKEKAYIMVMFAKTLGADGIRFAELQHCPELFVDAKDIFYGINTNPYISGCEQSIDGLVSGIEVKVRLTCGIVNPAKPMPSDTERKGSETKVMYTDSKVRNGWISNSKPDGFYDSCHVGSYSSAGSCH